MERVRVLKYAIHDENENVFRSLSDAPAVSGYVSDMAWKELDNCPDSLFITCAISDKSYSRQQVKEMAARFAGILMNQCGLQESDVVHICCRNSVMLAALMFGVWFSGGVLSGIPPEWTLDDWSGEVETLQSKVLVCMDSTLELALQVAARHEFVRAVILLSDGDIIMSANTSGAKVLHVDEDYLFNYEPVIESFKHTIAAEDMPFSAFLTSGSTGKPKPLRHSHKSWLVHIMTAISVQNYDMEEQHCELGMIELFFMPGVVQLFCCLLTGSHFVLADYRMPGGFGTDVDMILKAVNKYGCKGIWWMPSEITRVVSLPEIDSLLSGSPLKWVTYCGAVLPKTVAKEFSSLTNDKIELLPLYGSTEAGLVTYGPRLSDDSDWEGLALVPGIRVKIVDPASGKSCGLNEKGEILTCSPQFMMGYLGKTRNIQVQEQWFQTGDIGFFDDKGLLHVVARIKDVIRVMGSTIEPAEIEDLLLEHEAVSQAAVIGVKSEWVEVPKAFIVLKDKNANVDEIRSFVDSRVNHLKRLNGGIQVLDSMPLLGFGKVDKKSLRLQVEQHVPVIDV